MDLRARVTELAKLKSETPVVSVYLNTRWADEQQRERVRVFLKAELRRARKAPNGRRIEPDLQWIREQGEALLEQARSPEADGVALFACRELDLREVIPVRVPFEDAFVVAESPFVRPLAALLEQVPSALVVFVDGESARLIPLDAGGVGEEVRLQSEVPGHHRRGGWAQLAQSRYQRHIQDHRGRHFEAVGEVLTGLTEQNGARRIVMAGEPRAVAAFEKRLPRRIAERIVGRVAGARYEGGDVLVERALELLSQLEATAAARAVDAVLTEAAKSRQAVAGLQETLEAVARGAVRRLYLLRGFSARGSECVECGWLQPDEGPACRVCGMAVRPTELGETLVDRVVAAGGAVETVEAHRGLAAVGGVAALLRYAL